MGFMTKTLALAMKEVKKLPEEIQERFGFDLIDRVAAWHELREKIAEGVREADAGLLRPLSARVLIKEFRKRHAKRKK